MRTIAFLTLFLTAAGHASPSDTIDQATGSALQADARHAVQLLRGIDTNGLSKKQLSFVSCMRTRFGQPTAASLGKPRTATDRILAVYRDYWHAALTRPDTREQQEKRLDARLRALLKAPVGTDLDPIIERRIAADGNHSLEGRTGLLRELMVWRKEDQRKTSVALPEGRYPVDVHYLNGFRSFGWSYYATCGLAATGGWATDTGLFGVMPRYEDPDGEEFKVTFLGHETQHFADKARFKPLKDWELEYRAKLVEVTYANATRTKVLNRFITDQGDDPASPHSYANRKILADLVKRLQLSEAKDLYTADLARLQAAARDILIEDSRQRVAAGQSK